MVPPTKLKVQRLEALGIAPEYAEGAVEEIPGVLGAVQVGHLAVVLVVQV